MARGWESKSVESQMEEAEFRRERIAEAKLSADQLARQREIESLELSRVRVVNDLAEAKNPRYRESLDAALRHLDGKLAAFHADDSK